MAILASRLSSRIERGATRVVLHPSRVKIYTGNGNLRQVFPSGRLKHTFDASHGVRSQADYMEVLGAFYAVMGTPYDGLLWRDWADYMASRDNSVCTSLGGGSYQLGRVYSFGGVDYVRTITRPFNDGTLAVYDAGGSTLTATVDYTDGTFTVASGTPATWSGKFDVPVTFTDNEWRARLEVSTQNLHLVNESIMLEEVFE